MRERAVLARGSVDVESAPGDGTVIELRLGAAA
jgi:signal transduction histidine kinase